MNALFKLLLIGLTFALAAPAAAQVRIKDIVTVEGVRSNQLVGYGLVVGLNGTGDSLRNAPFTERAIEGMLERLGIGNLTEDQMRTANTAAVMVTAIAANAAGAIGFHCGSRQSLCRKAALLRFSPRPGAHHSGESHGHRR